ncbi:MAG: hypothetical protein EOM64_07230 [Erysipelotrichia bacterium]|nr:hypothetical protein [Erysipelotrichia bacterium]
MNPIVYTAADGYYFPSTYSAGESGIAVVKTSSSQITVSGAPNAAAAITLAAAAAKKTATTEMNTIDGKVDVDGGVGMLIILPPLAEGGTIDDANIRSEDNHISSISAVAAGSIIYLRYFATKNTVGSTAEIIVPVKCSDEFNDYNITAAISWMEKTGVDISGITAESRPYNRQAFISNSESQSLTCKVDNIKEDCRFYPPIYQGINNTQYELTTNAPTSAGDYNLIIKVYDNDEKHKGELCLPFAISPVEITVTPDSNQSKNYGETDPELKYSNTAALARTAGEDAGTYPISTGTLALMNSEAGGFTAANYQLKLAEDTAVFTINKIDYPGIKEASDKVSVDGDTKIVDIFSMIAPGAAIGSILAAGPLSISDTSVADGKLTYNAKASEAGTTGTITVPVTGVTNYNDCSIVAAVTSAAKSAVTISGISVENITYGESVSPSETAASCKIGDDDATEGCGQLINTYSGTGTTVYGSSPDAPVNAGTYQLVVSVDEANKDYTGQTNPVTFTIAQKELIVMPEAGQFKYAGHDDPKLNFTHSSASYNENSSFSGALTRAEGGNCRFIIWYHQGKSCAVRPRRIPGC